MPEPFEIQAEPDAGFRVTDEGTEEWQGARIRYRQLGAKGRWRKFLLEYDEPPTIVQLQAICAAHERGDTNIVLTEVGAS